MSHVVASYVCRKTMFYNQTSWKFRCSLNFRARNRRRLLKNFVDSLYDYDCSGVNDEESSEEQEAAIVTETDQSKPVSHRAADQSKLVSYRQ